MSTIQRLGSGYDSEEHDSPAILNASASGSEAAPADRVSTIYASIHRAVIEQRLLPGTKLPEDHLGAVFGSSRTLVRTALQRLARDGMVVQARNRGASVASPSPRDARDLFEARRVVEAAITASAAEKIRSEDVDDLRGILQDGRDALASGDRGRAIRHSGAFHLRVARIADQTVLAGFLEELVARSSLVIALYGHSGRSDCGDAEHAALIAALERRDGKTAVKRMIEHLHHIEADLDFKRSAQGSPSLTQVFAADAMPDSGAF